MAVAAVAAYFRDLLAAGQAESTVRSYGMDLLRWFRFLRAGTGVAWDQATRADARDFCRWLQVTGKQPRPHWRTGDQAGAPVGVRAGGAYAPSVRGHSETVLRAFYDFHLDVGSGPVINPFPLDRSRRGGRMRTGAYGHTPLSAAEDIPWRCRRLVIGSGADGALPVMKQVRQEARRREVDLVVLPTAEAIGVLTGTTKHTNAILHLTC